MDSTQGNGGKSVWKHEHHGKYMRYAPSVIETCLQAGLVKFWKAARGTWLTSLNRFWLQLLFLYLLHLVSHFYLVGSLQNPNLSVILSIWPSYALCKCEHLLFIFRWHLETHKFFKHGTFSLLETSLCWSVHRIVYPSTVLVCSFVDQFDDWYFCPHHLWHLLCKWPGIESAYFTFIRLLELSDSNC